MGATTTGTHPSTSTTIHATHTYLRRGRRALPRAGRLERGKLHLDLREDVLLVGVVLLQGVLQFVPGHPVPPRLLAQRRPDEVVLGL